MVAPVLKSFQAEVRANDITLGAVVVNAPWASLPAGCGSPPRLPPPPQLKSEVYRFHPPCLPTPPHFPPPPHLAVPTRATFQVPGATNPSCISASHHSPGEADFVALVTSPRASSCLPTPPPAPRPPPAHPSHDSKMSYPLLYGIDNVPSPA